MPALRVHVVQSTSNPSAAPVFVGQHWINTSTSRHWLAKGTSSVADWVEFIADTGITQLTGDVTAGPGSGSQVATIPNNTVTNAKLADVATATFKGRTTAGTGDPEDLTVAQSKTLLNLTGTNSGDQTITLTGDVTGSGTGSFAATIAANAVTNTKLRDSAGCSVIGRASPGAAGDPADITAASQGHVLRRDVGSLTFGAIDLSLTNTVGSSVLPAVNGGTGQSTFAAGDMFYAPNATTITKLAIGAQNAQLWVGPSNQPTWVTDVPTRKLIWETPTLRNTSSFGDYLHLENFVKNNDSFTIVKKNGSTLVDGVDYELLNSEILTGRKVYVNDESSGSAHRMCNHVHFLTAVSGSDNFYVESIEYHTAWKPKLRLQSWNFDNNEYHNIIGTAGDTMGPFIQTKWTPSNTFLTAVNATGSKTVPVKWDGAIQAYYNDLDYDSTPVKHWLYNVIQWLDFPTDISLDGNSWQIEAWSLHRRQTKHHSVQRWSPAGYFDSSGLFRVAKTLTEGASRHSRRNRVFKFRLRMGEDNIVTQWSDLTVTAAGPWLKYANDVKLGLTCVVY